MTKKSQPIRESNINTNATNQVMVESLGILELPEGYNIDRVFLGMEYQKTLYVTSMTADQLSLFIDALISELTLLRGDQ